MFKEMFCLIVGVVVYVLGITVIEKCSMSKNTIFLIGWILGVIVVTINRLILK